MKLLNLFMKILDVNVICISGDAGAGKTTLKNVLSCRYKQLGYNVITISVGSFFREKAESMNKTIGELNKLAEKDPSFDKEADSYIIAQIKKITRSLRTKRVYILDARMAWLFAGFALKVRITADSLTIGQRVFNAKREAGDTYKTVEQATIETYQRRLCEIKRYKERYGVTLNDEKNYDLVINASYASPDEVCDVIMDCAKRHLKGKPFAKLWRSPKTFYPLQKTKVKSIHKTAKFSINNSGFLPDRPVLSLMVNRFYYVFDRHSNLGLAIDAGINLVPYQVIARDREKIKDKNGNILVGGKTAKEYVGKMKHSNIYNYEKVHNFKFRTYPWLPKSPLLQELSKLKELSAIEELLETQKKTAQAV